MKSNDMEFPEGIREFRYQNMFMKVNDTNPEKPEVIFKNVDNNHHFHIYEIKDGKAKAVVTIYGKKKKHIELDLVKFLEILGKMIFSFWKKIEILDKYDPFLIDKEIIMYDTPQNPFFDKVKKKKTAYFGQEFPDGKKMFLDKVDTFKPQIGVIQNELGEETDMIIIRNGEILRINLVELDTLENDMKGEIKMDEILKPIDDVTKEELDGIFQN